MNLEAAVVVPVYRAAMDAAELLCWRQSRQVLSAHPFVLVAPEGLDLSAYQDGGPPPVVAHFSPEFFTSVAAYNRLMLDIGFYQRFTGYDYILICQLDAFVFSDQLLSWCAKGYDYVGAPWVKPWQFWPAWANWPKYLRQRLARLTKLSANSRWLRHRTAGICGNGGFSLRKVQTFIAVLKAPPADLALFYVAGDGDLFNEDIFWSFTAQHQGAPLKTPDWRTASQFAVEQEVTRSLAMLGGLPFGCHGWPKFIKQWRPVFARLGHTI